MTLRKGRIVLVPAVALAIVLGVGAGAVHLWMSRAAAAAPSAPATPSGPPQITAYASGTPDTIRITITHVGDVTRANPPVTVVTDRSIHDAALAVHLQHELATMPLVPVPSTPTYCAMGANSYDTYTLTWYRAGLAVEQASASPGSGCAFWKATTAGGESLYLPAGAPPIYADIDHAVSRA